MVAYVAPRITAGYIPKALVPGDNLQISTFTPTTALLVSDTIRMVDVPANPGSSVNGPVISSVTLDTGKLDSNGSPAIVLNVGDAVTANRYINAATVGQNGGIVANNVAGSIGYAPFANAFGTYTTVSNMIYSILITVGTAPATFQSAAITLKVNYNFDS